MIQLDKIKCVLKKNGRPVTRRSKKWKTIVIDWICAEVSRGKSLLDILPDEIDQGVPDFVEFNDWLLDENIKTQYGAAKGLRLNRLREKFIKILNTCKDKEDFEELKAVAQGLKELMQDQNENITIIYNSILPEDIWTKNTKTAKDQLMD